MAMRLTRLYENQLLTVILIASALVFGAIGVLTGVSIPAANPCLPATQQEIATALVMPLTYIEIAGSIGALLIYWLFIQNELFLGQNWVRWSVAVSLGSAIGLLGVWGLSFFVADCAKQALSRAGEFGIGPIFAFGNLFSVQFWNARVIEIASWAIASTSILWACRYSWLKLSRLPI